MGLKICSLFSGSTGNCTYVAGDSTEILIDAGVPLAKIEKAVSVLGTDLSKVSVLITHSHSDHVSGLESLVKKYPLVNVYAHCETAADLRDRVDSEHLKIFGNDDFYVGCVTVSPVTLSHDVPCVGFSLMCGGKKISYLTDTGVLPEYAISSTSDSDLVMIECNHSPELLASNPRYPYSLKRRIAGLRGHLSNGDCADAVLRYARSGVKYFILAHLSKENNYAELAYSACYDALDAAGYGDVCISVALPDKLSGLMEIV